MYIITYMQEATAQAALHLIEDTATAQAAILQGTEGVSDVVLFGPVLAQEPENLADWRLNLRSNSQLQDRLKIVVLTRANNIFTWAQPNETPPQGEEKPDAMSVAAAQYAILNAAKSQDWFPVLWENFLAKATQQRVTVAGIEAWAKTNWPIFALLWQDKLKLS